MGEPTLVPTGIEGLDAVLRGGLPRNRLHLVQGATGTGKTTLGLQFTLAGASAGDSCLYVSLAETEAELRGIAESHGWSLDGVPIFYRRPSDEGEEGQTVLHPAEVELPAAVAAIVERVEAMQPRRLVIDSLSELRVLAREPRWYRDQLMRLRARLHGLDCTALLLDAGKATETAESLLGSVIRLERHTPSFGPDRRTLQIVKMRGHEYQSGTQDVRIRRGGLAVFPRLVAAEERGHFPPEVTSTGLAELDAMLGGGLDRGGAVLLLGPTGTGKSTLALQCAAAAAARGERALIFVFDERVQTVFQRARGVGIDLERQVEAGTVSVRQVDPAELTPGEFADELRREVAEQGIRLIVIDSLNGYLYAMPEERLLVLHLHELLAHLSHQGVTSLLTGVLHQGLDPKERPGSQLDVSYLADTVLLLRIVERAGRLQKALTVYKRRAGSHENAVRELRLEPGRISIGEILPLSGLAAEVPELGGGGIEA